MTIRLPRRPLLLLLGVLALYAVPVPAAETPSPKLAAAESEARLKKDVFFLASDECEGRGPGTKGLNKAADHIAAEFKKAGLKPGGPDGSYFQPFTVPGSIQDAPAVLKLRGPQGQEIELKEGVHFYPMGVGYAGKATGAAVAFAGYGASTTNWKLDGKNPAKYDDYADLDVEDKVVVVLRDLPRGSAPRADDDSPRFPGNASLAAKLLRAEQAKAAAVLFVNDADTARTGDDLLDFNYSAVGRGRAKIPAFHVKRSVLEAMLHSADKDLRAIEADIDRDAKPQSFDLRDWTVSFEVKMHRGDIALKNVVGVLEGNGPLAKETVVVGAHYDHLGYGGGFGSLANLKKMAIHHGADDNASGSTAVIELARRFGAMENRKGRRLVFMTFSGEEMGLLGSAHYAKEPLFPLEDTVAMFNLDMVGRLPKDKKTGKEVLLVEGSTSSKTFDDLVEKINKNYDFEMRKEEKFDANSDHASFYQKKIPVLFFWTGIHPDYHRPSDTADKINVAGMRKIVDMSEEVLKHFTTVEKRPDYVEGRLRKRGPGGGPRLGFTPGNYGEEGEGVLIAAVTDNLPAAKAGLKAGDRIVELAGKQVKNMTHYMDIMSDQKAGDTIEAVILRDDKKMTVKIKLE